MEENKNQIPYAVPGGNLYCNAETGAIVSCDRTITRAEIPERINGIVVTEIESYAFFLCESLTRVILPNSVTVIGRGAFTWCKSLTHITIPASVTQIGERAFEGCSSLHEISYGGSQAAWDKIDIGTENEVLKNIAFAEAATLPTGEAVPNRQDRDAAETFCNPAVVETLESMQAVETFYNPDLDWEDWDDEMLPADPEEGEDTQAAEKQVAYAVTGGNLYFNPVTGTIVGCDKTVTRADIPAWLDGAAVTAIGEYAFYNCTTLTAATIPDSVTQIGGWAFQNCEQLTKITIPEGVTEIGLWTFENCKKLNNVELPSRLTKIGGWAFASCESLSFVLLPNQVTTLEMFAFSGCTSLSGVTLPASITLIAEAAFSNCVRLTDVYYGGTRAAWQNIQIGTNNDPLRKAAWHDTENIPQAVYEAEADGVVVLPTAEKNRVPYAVTGGNLYFDAATGTIVDCDKTVTKAEIPASIDGVPVTAVGEKAFQNCKQLTRVCLPDEVTEIGAWAFSGCENLTNVLLSNRMTVIQTGTFSGCTNLVHLTMPSSVTTVESFAFEDCPNLVDVYYGASQEAWQKIQIGQNNPWLQEAIRYYPKTLPNAKPYAVTGGNLYFDAATGAIVDCDETVTHADIPAQLYDMPVLAIEQDAFENCERLRGVILPPTLVKIGERAFVYCTSLSKVEIPHGVAEIEAWAFAWCESLRDVTLPGSVTVIGDHAFANCIGLTELSLPNSVTTIGESAFLLCASLTRVTLPEGVTTIAEETFSCCTGLKAVDIPVGVTKMERAAFERCEQLTDIYYGGDQAAWQKIEMDTDHAGLQHFTVHYTNAPRDTKAKSRRIPYPVTGGKLYFDAETGTIVACDSTVRKAKIPKQIQRVPVTAIGKEAFQRCASLTEVTLPNSVTAIGEDAFSWCRKLQTLTIPSGVVKIERFVFAGSRIEVASNNRAYCSVDGILFTKDRCTLVQFPCQHPERIYIVPAGVTAIGDDAFASCNHLTEVTLPDSVTALGEKAFAFCEKLTWVILPRNLTEIGKQAFFRCEALLGMAIPKDVTAIGKGAFADCPRLVSIAVAPTNRAYCSVDGVLFTKDQNELVQFPAGHSRTTYKIPNGVTTIGESAFDGCKNLTGVTLPNSVTVLEGSAFRNCTGLTRMHLPDSVTAIGEEVFLGCRKLSGITLPDGVTEIGKRAFFWCSQLTDITLPSGVLSLGSGAFSDCENLTKIEVAADNRAYCSVDGILFDKARRTLLQCPGKCPDTVYTVPDSVQTIDERAFSGCKNLTAVTIPDGVTEIGEGAFWGCKSLTDIKLPDGLTVLRKRTFDWCSRLRSVTIPAGVTELEAEVFSWCESLTEVTLPAGLTTIGKQAFHWCKKLTAVSLPSAVTTIEAEAFNRCTQLKAISVDAKNRAYCSIDGILFTKDQKELLKFPSQHPNKAYTIPDSVTTIGELAFEDCGNLTAVTIPDSVTEIGELAFIWCNGLTEMNIPAGVTKIGNGAFSDCTNLKSISVHPDNAAYCSLDGALFTKDKSALLQFPCTYPHTTYTIPDGVTEIGERAFNFCKSLTAVTLPSGVVTLGESAFSWCKGLTRMMFPDGVTTVGQSAFSRCENLTGVTLPDSVTEIGRWAFDDCPKLTDVYYGGSQASWQKIYIGAQNDALQKATIHFTEAAAKQATGKSKTANPPAQVDRTRIPYAVKGGNLYFNAETGTVMDCDETVTEADIPASIHGVAVTAIRPIAFSLHKNLASVTIPGSVTEIAERTFAWRDSLTDVTISSGMTKIGEGAFYKCANLTRVTLSDSVIEIAALAFDACEKLTDVYYGGSQASWKKIHIGRQNDALQKATIHFTEAAAKQATGKPKTDNPTAQADKTRIPYAVKGGNLYFNAETGTIIDCDETVTEADIPAAIDGVPVTALAERLFALCRNLTSVTLLSGVNSIGKGAFSNCRSLTKIMVVERNPVYCSIDGVLFTRDRRELLQFPCAHSQTTYKIPEGVTKIGRTAFFECEKLTRVTIPNGVTTIGMLAFAGCNHLTLLTLPDGVTTIETGAFNRCEKLKSVTLPESLTTIGDSAFLSCPKLTDVSYGGTRATWQNIQIGKNNDVLQNAAIHYGKSVSRQDVPTDKTRIPYAVKGGNLYCNAETGTIVDCDKSVTEADIPNRIEKVAVTAIGKDAFKECKKLTCVTLPDGVTELAATAFLGCSSLTDIKIPSSVTTIGGGTFGTCSRLTGLTIPAGVTKIAVYTFVHCTSLTCVAIPESVTRIELGAFARCDSLTDVYYGSTPEAWQKIQIEIQNEALQKATIHYAEVDSQPATDKTRIPYAVNGGNLYFDAETGEIVGCDDTVTTAEVPASINGVPVTAIGEVAFHNCESLTRITIPNGVTTIGGLAFYRCKSLTDITIPNRVTTIGQSAFSDCKSLTDITIPDSVTKIGENAFSGCWSLTRVTIPNRVTEIGRYAFPSSMINIDVSANNPAYCSVNGVLFTKDRRELLRFPGGHPSTTYQIPDGVTKIAKAAFYSCKSLTDITIPNTVTEIGADAFCWCESLTGVTIPNGVTEIGAEAFHSCKSLTDITIPNRVTTIGEKAFCWCESLTRVTIPDGVTEIGAGAFAWCKRLTSVNIPTSVLKIQKNAFEQTKLTDVYYDGSRANWKKIEISSRNYRLSKAEIHYRTSLFHALFG